MQNFADPWQRGQKHSRDLGAPEITRREDEHSGLALSQRGDLQWAVSQPLVLREHNPGSVADRPKPGAVLLITRKVVVVDLDQETRLDELSSERIYSQRPVDEEYRFVRRPRSGLLLRWH